MGDDDEKKYMAGCCCFVILAISGGLVGCSFKTLEYNQVGIDFDSTSQSINEDKLFHNGRHFIGLAHSFFVYPTKLLTVEFAERDDIGNPDGQSGPLSAGSKDGQAIEIEISFFIRLRTKEVSNVVNLYKEYRTTFMPTVISKATNAIKETTVKFVTLEFFTNRTDISAEIHRALSGALESMSMEVEAVQLRNIKLSDNFEEAIIDKIVSAQADKTANENGLALHRNGCVSRTDTDGGHVCIDSRKDGLNSGSWDVLSLGVSALSRAQSGASDENVEGKQLERGPEDAVVAEEWMRTPKWIRKPEALLGNSFRVRELGHGDLGSHAYLVTQTGAKKLLSIEARLPTDTLMIHASTQGHIRGLLVTPSLVEQEAQLSTTELR